MRASPMPFLKALLTLLAMILALPAAAQVQRPGATHHLAAELVADGPAQPGKTLTLALHFRPEQGWHGYWSNPGDAGYGMRLEWKLPQGWKAGDVIVGPRTPVLWEG